MHSLSSYINAMHRLTWMSYNIGFVERQASRVSDLDISYDDVHWLDKGQMKCGWFADPFILDVSEDRVELLVEEYVDGCGQLSKITVGRPGYKLLDVKPVLSLATHLSFPLIVRDHDQIYICPENSQAGYVKIYRYDRATGSLVDGQVIIDAPLLDTQILRIGECWYAFGVISGGAGGADTSCLYVYKGESLCGKYTLIQTIHNAFQQERGAGEIFMLDGTWLRPAQKCDSSYGEATILKSLQCTDGKFSQTEVLTIRPDKSRRWGLCLHTFNMRDGLIVVDGLDYDHPVFMRIFGNLIKLWHKIRRQS